MNCLWEKVNLATAFWQSKKLAGSA